MAQAQFQSFLADKSAAPGDLVVQVAIPGLRHLLSYRLPRKILDESGCTEESREFLRGREVVVELGRREAQGWIIQIGENSESGEPSFKQQLDPSPGQGELFSAESIDRRLKPVRELKPAFLPDQLPLFEWMAEYYGVSIADILENALPAREPGKLEEILHLRAEVFAAWRQNPDPLEIKLKRTKVQKQIFSLLANSGGSLSKASVLEVHPNSHAAIAALEEKGFLHRLSCPQAIKNSASNDSAKPALHQLTDGQEQARKSIALALDKRSFAPLLLFGVTGSGKTEVYMRAIEKVLAEGGGALVVVPEIALTPQLYDQFEARLGEPIALLHSEVGRRSRWQSWEGLLSGELRVAIGARSAVFAPVKNLRLVIVDEEHESSYKQSEGLHYHARDVAVMRAKLLGATVVLGSATPSFESLINVNQGRYRLISLPDRVSNRQLPSIEVVDLGKIRRKEMPSANISPRLYEEMKQALERGGQVVILFNRRGFSSYLQCSTCQDVVCCSHCSISMTYHKGRDRLLCHYCNEAMTPPKFCKSCRNPQITEVEEGSEFGLLEARGSGTEHLVEDIQGLFPEAVIERMDRDTVGKKDSYRRILGRMRSGEANILVGTQMIAKGHDLPGVTLVGIIDADVGLHTPDFRSSEKTFQLITQASGRAGRGNEPGKVIIQTRQPNHPTIVATQTGRFKAFARYELDFRKQLQYPPWGRLLRLVVSSPFAQEAFQASHVVKNTLMELAEGFSNTEGALRIIGPAPAPLERLRGRFRFHILVKSASAKNLSRIADALDRWKDDVKEFRDFRLVIDIDPVEML